MSYRMTAMAVLALAGSSLAAVPAKAQGLLDIGKALIGIPSAPEDPIEYRERAPLVVPPNQNLRPPADSAAPDERRANWPQDPDVVARRKAAAEARKPVYEDYQTRGQLTRRLTVDEIRAGRVAGQEVPRTPVSGPTDSTGGDRARANVYGGIVTLKELDGKSAAAALAESREEPPREYLTDPPVGLRRPAANAPFKATREGSLGAREAPSPLDIFKEGSNTR